MARNLHQCHKDPFSFNPGIKYIRPPKSLRKIPQDIDFKVYDDNSKSTYYFKIKNEFGSASYFGIILDCDVYIKNKTNGTIEYRRQLLKIMGENEIETLNNELKLTIAMSQLGISPPAGPFFVYNKLCQRDDIKLKKIKRELSHIRDIRDHSKIERIFDNQYIGLILMEKIVGKTLDEYIKVGTVSPTTKQQVYNSICTLIQRMHHNNIVHGDLHTQNILIENSNSRPWIIDWGLSKNISKEKKWIYNRGLGDTCSVKKWRNWGNCNNDRRVECKKANWDCERMPQSEFIYYNICGKNKVGLFDESGWRQDTSMPRDFVNRTEPATVVPTATPTPRGVSRSRHSTPRGVSRSRHSTPRGVSRSRHSTPKSAYRSRRLPFQAPRKIPSSVLEEDDEWHGSFVTPRPRKVIYNEHPISFTPYEPHRPIPIRPETGTPKLTPKQEARQKVRQEGKAERDLYELKQTFKRKYRYEPADDWTLHQLNEAVYSDYLPGGEIEKHKINKFGQVTTEYRGLRRPKAIRYGRYGRYDGGSKKNKKSKKKINKKKTNRKKRKYSKKRK